LRLLRRAHRGAVCRRAPGASRPLDIPQARSVKTCNSCGASCRPTSVPSTSCAATKRAIAVEIKRIGTIDAVEQLTRYLKRIEIEGCRGVLAAQSIKPQARTLAEARGIHCVEVDLAVLRGEREPELTLFAD